MDRIDFYLPLQSITLQNHYKGESSHTIRKRVMQAQTHQLARMSCLNGQASSVMLLKHLHISDPILKFIKEACYHEKWRYRTQLKVLRTTRTIADLAGEQSVKQAHIEDVVNWKKPGPQMGEEAYA